MRMARPRAMPALISVSRCIFAAGIVLLVVCIRSYYIADVVRLGRTRSNTEMYLNVYRGIVVMDWADDLRRPLIDRQKRWRQLYADDLDESFELAALSAQWRPVWIEGSNCCRGHGRIVIGVPSIIIVLMAIGLLPAFSKYLQTVDKTYGFPVTQIESKSGGELKQEDKVTPRSDTGTRPE